MTCPKCNSQIQLDLMRCLACGYDMLPQDITQSSLESRRASAEAAGPAGNARFVAELDSVLQEMGSSMKSLEVREEGQRRATRSRWLLVAFLAVMIAIALLLSLGR